MDVQQLIQNYHYSNVIKDEMIRNEDKLARLNEPDVVDAILDDKVKNKNILLYALFVLLTWDNNHLQDPLDLDNIQIKGMKKSSLTFQHHLANISKIQI